MLLIISLCNWSRRSGLNSGA